MRLFGRRSSIHHQPPLWWLLFWRSHRLALYKTTNMILLMNVTGKRKIKANVRQSNSSVPSGQWYSVQSQRWDKGIHVPSPHVNSSLLHLWSGASVTGSVGSSDHSTTNTSRFTRMLFRLCVSVEKCITHESLLLNICTIRRSCVLT